MKLNEDKLLSGWSIKKYKMLHKDHSCKFLHRVYFTCYLDEQNGFQ
jgi:hypothetical protein